MSNYKWIFLFIFNNVLMTAILCGAEKNYTYIVTVGLDSGQYDYTDLQSAINAMNNMSPPLDPNVLGCIEIYAGQYYHNSGSSAGSLSEPEKWLPAYCDLIGKGDLPADVVISHPTSGTSINNYILIAGGSNLVNNVKFYNSISGSYYARNGVYFKSNGTLDTCFIQTRHVSFSGEDNITIKNSNIATYMVDAVVVDDNFAILDTEITLLSYYDATGYRFVETAAGICASGAGIIKNVVINGSDVAAYSYEGAGFYGIHTYYTSRSDDIYVSNVQINLTLEIQNSSARLRACGILNGSPWSAIYPPQNNSTGRVIVSDCTINVTGIEGSGPSGIMVEGVCVRGGGTVEFHENNSIAVSRTSNPNATGGYVYLVRNDNGVVAVEYPYTAFNPCDPNNPAYPHPDYVYGVITPYRKELRWMNPGDQTVGWLDNLGNFYYLGNVYENLPTIPLIPGTSFRILDDLDDTRLLIDCSNGDFYLRGQISQNLVNLTPSASESNVIIRNDNDITVSYFDEQGNLYLQGSRRKLN